LRKLEGGGKVGLPCWVVREDLLEGRIALDEERFFGGVDLSELVCGGLVG
jgi:hypothetical protein